MTAIARAVAVVDDRRYQLHQSPPGHPECPERLLAVGEAIAARESELDHRPPREASDEELLLIHPAEHVSHVSAAAQQAPIHLDPDTYLSPESLSVARLAAGASIDLAAAVARGEISTGLAAVRPPGHHAEADRAMGFCLFNNVAIAARALQKEVGLERVLILDWDVHHGNGTQHLFESDPSVLYFSTHQFPFYPGTGAASEAGVGKGLGATVNVPMPAGCGDAEYVGVMQRVFVPVVQQFRPEIILVSCGFDAHRNDPLASMELTGEGFARMARCVRSLADELCEGRLALILEGGYSPVGLRQGTDSVLEVLLDPDPQAPEKAIDLEPGGMLRQIVDTVAGVHRGRYPDLGSA